MREKKYYVSIFTTSHSGADKGNHELLKSNAHNWISKKGQKITKMEFLMEKEKEKNPSIPDMTLLEYKGMLND